MDRVITRLGYRKYGLNWIDPFNDKKVYLSLGGRPNLGGGVVNVGGFFRKATF